MLLKQIRHFQAIVQENSFTEAAEACNISQSGISLSIKALEEELGVTLMLRKNRKFELTEAGKLFYKKSLIIAADLEQLCREVVRVERKDAAVLSLGFPSSYIGNEFNQAIAAFSEKYPAVELKVMSGNHEDLYNALRLDEVDLVLNDQRRAFSDEYENVILAEIPCYVEIASHNPAARLDALEVEELKNTPCIIVASEEQQAEERDFYREIIGFKGDFLFAETLQAARVMVVSNRGVMPCEKTGASLPDDYLTLKPLTRNGVQLKRTYCAFWKKDNSGYYVEEFAGLLKSMY